MLDPRLESDYLIVDKCRYMSSKKKPLWLVFRNKEQDVKDTCVIFKSGDDLRQDILTLQLLKLMDQIWLSKELDLHMTPYNCIATGDGMGMIEIVLNAETISKIHIKYGGGAVGALKVKTITNFLKEHNPGEEKFENARNNFVRTCAGYCVATYALGVGDRHVSNIMITKDGNLFHIDFGHFLGNFKSKYGVCRERTPFVFTPEMAHVMGGKKYASHYLFERFKVLCTKAFVVLRSHHQLFVSMFKLMLHAGMPELEYEKNIEYFTDMMMLQKSEKEASESFLKYIKNALSAMSRKLDNLVHNIKHNE